jgi:S-adenosylmethionine hydrolase
MNPHKLLVFQTDFGRLESTVAEMYGVALSVDPDLKIHETTHYIPQFNIWEASYRLFQALPYWPEGTVFVSVVDPGVGSSRKSVVAETESGCYVVTPDNGTLTHLYQRVGIRAVREIDESVNRLHGTASSHTFHGRDVYGYTGARLAAGVIDFAGVGPEISVHRLLRLATQEPFIEKGRVTGTVEILDTRYGNVFTTIPMELLAKAGSSDGDTLEVLIEKRGREVYRRNLPYSGYFSVVAEGEELVYNNELLYVSLAVNQGDFAARHGIESGPDWTIQFTKK